MAHEIKCMTCGDTGDVHTIDGQWRGECTACDAAEIIRMRAEIERLKADLSRERAAHEETRLARNRARLDGIALALGVDDSVFTFRLARGERQNPPCVVITLTPATVVLPVRGGIA